MLFTRTDIFASNLPDKNWAMEKDKRENTDVNKILFGISKIKNTKSATPIEPTILRIETLFNSYTLALARDCNN
jgi:hypothetical protein